MELIFVYNADSGLLNLFKDGIHKLLRPETYPCKLCELTYGSVSEKRRWKAFRQCDARDMRFFHKDEFEDEYGQVYEYPVVLERQVDAKGVSRLSAVLGHDDLERVEDVDELIRILSG